jgi:DNA-directed RNA polymerase sigma subunit (sigma70/sigma32)
MNEYPLGIPELRAIIKKARQEIQVIQQAEDRAMRNKIKAKAEEKKVRLRLVYAERESGKTYKEVGQVFGVGAYRARELYVKAAYLNIHGKLFPQSTNV